MKKENLIKSIKTGLKDGVITKNDILPLLDNDGVAVKDNSVNEKHSLNNIFYIFGTVVVIIGITALAWQLWPTLGSVGRILITFGVGIILTFISAFNLNSSEKQSHLSSVFMFIGGFLIPGGVFVALSEMGIEFNSEVIPLSVFAMLALFYFLLATSKKESIATFFSLANATVAVYLFQSLALGDLGIDNLYMYVSIVIGISYLLIGSMFEKNWNKPLVPLAYSFGTLAILGSSFVLMFSQPIFELLLFVFITILFYLSVTLSQRTILAISTIFLIFHLIYITNEYFADSLGWPISMVILGFVFIGLGYASFNIDRNYIKK